MTSSLPAVIFRADKNGLQYVPAGVLFAVEGTVYPGAPYPVQPLLDNGEGWWAGFSSGIGGGLMNEQDGLFAWASIGYVAAITPMMPSIQLGRSGLVTAIKFYADAYARKYGTLAGLAIFITGYSQGACVTGLTWVNDFLAEDGVLHYLLPYVWRIYNFGDPFRTPGIAHGNELAGLPLPSELDGEVTGGIGGELDLTAEQTNYKAPDGRPVVHCFANDGDLYTHCPVGTDPWKHMASPGKVGNSIMKVIFKATFWNVVSIAKALFHPIGMVQEIYNGLKFAATGAGPHMQYGPGMEAAIGEMLAIGNSLPHNGC